MLLQVGVQVQEYLRQVLKSRNALSSFLQRMKVAAGSDAEHAETLALQPDHLFFCSLLVEPY